MLSDMGCDCMYFKNIEYVVIMIKVQDVNDSVTHIYS